MRPQLITLLVVLCLAYYCHSIKVHLKANIQGKNPNQTLSLNCTYKLDKNEALVSMIMTKDNLRFFTYDNKTHTGSSIPIPGLDTKEGLTKFGKSYIYLGYTGNINKTTYGKYICTVYAKKSAGSDWDLVDDSDQKVVSEGQSTHGGGQSNPYLAVDLITSIPQNIANKTKHMKCTPRMYEDEHIINMSMTKDDKQFYTYDNKTKSNGTSFPIPGINKVIIVGVGEVNIPNVSKTTSGMYKCTVTTGNSTKSRTGFDQRYVSGNQAMALSLPLLTITLITFSMFK